MFFSQSIAPTVRVARDDRRQRGYDVRQWLVFILVFVTALAAPLAYAHSVAVDGDAGDWTGRFPPGGGYDAEIGEWGWRSTDPSPLQEFRVTADERYVYFLVQLAEVKTGRGEGAPLLQIAVDTDRQPASGQTVFYGFSGSRLADGPHRWERLIRTSFGSGRFSPAVLDANFTDLSTSEDLAILMPQRGTVEMRVRWAALGVTPPATLRFTTALFTADARDNVLPEGATALAVVMPGDVSSKTHERIDAYADVAFRANGQASPPPLPVRIGRWDVNVPPPLREPMLYGAGAGLVLIALGILSKLRGRPKSWWWG